MRYAVLLVVLAFAFACGKKHDGIAELTRADGPVERQQGAGAWGGAAVNTKFYLGDAARTADGAAQLTLVGAQVLEMQPHTVLRFGTGPDSATNIKVELGSVEVINTASAGLEIGNVKVAPGAKVRITASNVELLIGNAQLANGVQLEIGKPIGLDLGPVTVVDAGIIDAAAPPPPIDAGVTAGDVTYDVTGKGAEIQGPNDKTWAPVEGKGSIPLGAKLRLKRGSAKVMFVSGTTSLELSGASSQITIKENLLLGLDLGAGLASVGAAQEGKVGVPGG
ncbi:MAG TPA: hypothetical protein VGC41_12385, partial [Kofleriaceae bacterium]